MEMTKQRDFSTLSPKQNMNIWKINLIPSQPLHLNAHFSLALDFFFLLFFPSFSTILIYLLTLQTVPVIFFTPRFLHWFSVQLILNQLVLVDLVKTWNLEHFAAHRPGLRIRDHVDGNGGQEKEQQVPGCCNARARPPGGNNWHAAERDGARCPGHRQGNACINTSAATIRAKALGSPVIKPPLPITGEWNITCVAEISVKLLTRAGM